MKEELYLWIRNLAVFYIFFTAVLNLIPDQKYEKYVRFFMGLLLIFMMSTYEEVGHGMAHIPSEISELLAVDMGCIGLDLACTEQQVSICAKDSSGPYDYDFTTHLITLAKENNINFAVDIYPMYGSDVSAARSAGNDVKGALICPGVHASHCMERTHIDGVMETMKLILAYICA